MCEVKIVNRKSKEVVETLNCNDPRDAQRVEKGININLDHTNFFTQIIEAPGSEKCPNCQEELKHMTARSTCPAHRFCPKCFDVGYDPETLEIIIKFRE
jgi:hypothetical protein